MFSYAKINLINHKSTLTRFKKTFRYLSHLIELSVLYNPTYERHFRKYSLVSLFLRNPPLFILQINQNSPLL